MKPFVYIMTSAPIRMAFDGHDVYDAYDRVAQGLSVAPLAFDASSLLVAKNFPFHLDCVQTIYTGSAGQTTDTARLLCATGKMVHATIHAMSLFDGIRFSMRQLMTKEYFHALPYERAIAEARKNFVYKFYDDQLFESRQSVMERIDRVRAIARASSTPTLFISHSFFMRLLQLAISDPSCFQTRERLLRAFCPEKKPFAPLSGFPLA